MVEQPGDEGVGQRAQSQTAGVVGVREGRGAVAPQRQVQVQTAAGAVGERLAHEGRGHAALLGHHRQQVPQGDHPVGGGEGVCVGEVLLELTVAVLVVVGVVAPAEGVHGLGDGGEVLVHAGEAAGVVAGALGGVLGVGRAECAVRAALDEEVLDLGADLELQAQLGGSRELLAEDDPGREGPRCALDVRVAVHDRQPRPQEGHRHVGRRVGDGDEVGVLGFLPHGADGIAGEAHAVGLQLLDRLDRDELGARLAGEVDEQGEDELDAVRAGLRGQIGLPVGGVERRAARCWDLSLDLVRDLLRDRRGVGTGGGERHGYLRSSCSLS